MTHALFSAHINFNIPIPQKTSHREQGKHVQEIKTEEFYWSAVARQTVFAATKKKHKQAAP